MSEVVAQQPRSASAVRAIDARQVLGFSFYRVDPDWRRLPAKTRSSHAWEFLSTVDSFRSRLVVSMSYSLQGLRADVDFLLWRVAENLDTLQEMTAALYTTKFGAYLTMPYNYLSMTRRSVYVDKLDPDHPDKRRFITPQHSKYLFVYPFWKTAEWYMLPMAQRQAMMDEHIVTGNKYPSVKIHTSYSFGLDDQEFVLAFESDSPADFLDLVMELREAKARPYTLRDTPIFTCINKPLKDIMKELGG